MFSMAEYESRGRGLKIRLRGSAVDGVTCEHIVTLVPALLGRRILPCPTDLRLCLLAGFGQWNVSTHDISRDLNVTV